MGREIEKRAMLVSAESGKKRVGQLHLTRYLRGNRLSPSQAIKAKCYDCNGMGEEDTCENEECALWAYSQFAKDKPKSTRPAPKNGFKKKRHTQVAP